MCALEKRLNKHHTQKLRTIFSTVKTAPTVHSHGRMHKYIYSYTFFIRRHLIHYIQLYHLFIFEGIEIPALIGTNSIVSIPRFAFSENLIIKVP